MTLAADSQRVLFHDGEKIQCLDRRRGQALWASAPLAKKENMRSSQAPTLVIYDEHRLLGHSYASTRADPDAGTGSEISNWAPPD